MGVVVPLQVSAEVTHQIEKFTFTNNEDKDVDDLTVTFYETGVRTVDLGPFGKAVTDGQTVKISDGVVKIGGKATLTFERNGSFVVKEWYWTIGGERYGTIKTATGRHAMEK
jgi:hypothetical protein